jgi:WD40 repeat protein
MTPLLLTAALLQPAPRLDAFGDPLPTGALVRLGTQRLRPGGIVTSLVFTFDGKRLVSANTDTGVQVWNAADGKLLHAAAGPWEDVEYVSLSGDGARAVFLKSESCVVLDIASGKVLARWDNLALLRHAWLSQGGQRLAVTYDRKVHVGKVGDKELAAIAPVKGRIGVCVAFGPDDKSVALGTNSGQLSRLDSKSGEEITTYAVPKERWPDYAECAFSPDGKILAAACRNAGGIDLYDAASGKHLRTLSDFHSQNPYLAFSGDGRYLAVPHENANNISVWHVATGKKLGEVGGHNGWVSAAAVSPDGKTVATAGDDLTLRLWDLATGKPLHAFGDLPGRAPGVRFTPDGKTLLCSGYYRGRSDAGGGPVWLLHDAATGQARGRFICECAYLNYASLSGNGSTLAVMMPGQAVEVRDIASDKVLLTAQPPQGWRTVLVELNSAGTRLLLPANQPADVGLDRQRTQLWDVTTGQVLLDVPGESSDAWYFSADGATLFIRHRNRRSAWLESYDTASGRRHRRAALAPGPQDSTALALHERMVAVSDYGTDVVAVYDAFTGHQVHRLTAPGQRFHVLAFSPIGRWLAAGTTQGHVLVWDLTDGRRVAEVAGHRGPVGSLAWSPDGTRLASGGADTTVLVWDTTAWLARPEEAPTAAQLAALWEDLASADGVRGFAAVGKLAQSPAAVALLRSKVKPATAAGEAALRAVVADLGSDKFAVRQKAQRELAGRGEAAALALEAALAGKPAEEQRRRAEILLAQLDAGPAVPECARLLRALQALQWAGTPEAQALLAELAAGEPGAWLTREARTVLMRLP